MNRIGEPHIADTDHSFGAVFRDKKRHFEMLLPQRHLIDVRLVNDAQMADIRVPAIITINSQYVKEVGLKRILSVSHTNRFITVVLLRCDQHGGPGSVERLR